LIAMATAVLPVLTAWLTKLVIDALAGGAPGGLEPLLWLAGGLVGSGLMMALLPRVSLFLEQESGRAITRQMQDQLYRAVETFTGVGAVRDTRVPGPAAAGAADGDAYTECGG
jgi:ATP-binding cassette, subfamily B, bacterial